MILNLCLYSSCLLYSWMTKKAKSRDGQTKTSSGKQQHGNQPSPVKTSPQQQKRSKKGINALVVSPPPAPTSALLADHSLAIESPRREVQAAADGYCSGTDGDDGEDDFTLVSGGRGKKVRNKEAVMPLAGEMRETRQVESSVSQQPAQETMRATTTAITKSSNSSERQSKKQADKGSKVKQHVAGMPRALK